MIRKTAITMALKHIEFDARIVSANGFISRDLFSISDTRPTFYMIGSMGLASSIGLGIALKDLEKKVFFPTFLIWTYLHEFLPDYFLKNTKNIYGFWKAQKSTLC